MSGRIAGVVPAVACRIGPYYEVLTHESLSSRAGPLAYRNIKTDLGGIAQWTFRFATRGQEAERI
jgi:hypothetical protein